MMAASDSVSQGYSQPAPGYFLGPVARLEFLTSEPEVFVRLYDRDFTAMTGLRVRGPDTGFSLRDSALGVEYFVTAQAANSQRTEVYRLTPAAGLTSKTLALTEKTVPAVGTQPMYPTPADRSPTWGTRKSYLPMDIKVSVGGVQVAFAILYTTSFDGGVPGLRKRVLAKGKDLFSLRESPQEAGFITTTHNGVTYLGAFALPEGSSRITLDFAVGTGALTATTERFSPSELALDKYPGKVAPLVAAGFKLPVIYTIEVQVTKDGEQTPAVTKTATMYTDQSSTTPWAYFIPKDGYSSRQTFGQGIAREWFFNVVDIDPPRAGILRWPTITGSQVMRFDLTTGDSSGGGDAGTVVARTSVTGMPASRDVVLLEQDASGDWRVVGFTRTDADGSATVEVKVNPDTKVYGMATDDYGIGFEPNLEVFAGQRLRPSLFTGWLYEVTEAGTLPGSEPEWWPAVGDNPSRPIGTARAIAVRYFRPLAHGPVPVEMI